MLIRACMIIRIQPFDQQFFYPLKSCCFQSKKLKIKLMKSQKNEGNFADSRWFCSFFCFQSPHGCAWGRGTCSYSVTLWSAGWHKGVTHCCHFELRFVAMMDAFSLRYEKYSLHQKEDLAPLCFKYKQEAEGKSKGKHWDAKRKKYVSHNLAYKSRAVREYFPSLKNADSDDPFWLFHTIYYYSVPYYYWLFEILPPYTYYYFTLYCY